MKTAVFIQNDDKSATDGIIIKRGLKDIVFTIQYFLFNLQEINIWLKNNKIENNI